MCFESVPEVIFSLSEMFIPLLCSKGICDGPLINCSKSCFDFDQTAKNICFVKEQMGL